MFDFDLEMLFVIDLKQSFAFNNYICIYEFSMA